LAGPAGHSGRYKEDVGMVISSQNGQPPSIEPQLKSAEEIRKILSLFNYTLESLSLLLVPMFTNK
jgi:hypothetical protein